MRFFSTLTICGCLAMAVATASGCVSISAPKWPWSKPDPAATAEAKLEGELGEDAEGDVISSEFISGDQGTPWELGIVDQLISRRYNAGRIVLATTNYEPEAWQPQTGKKIDQSLEDRVGRRILSRMTEMCDVVEVRGPDFRTTRLPRRRPT